MGAQTFADIKTFVTSVRAVVPVTPRVVRVTVGGGDLAEFRPIGPDQFVYLLLPPPGRRELTIDRVFSWDAYRVMPDEERPVGAYYTVRHWRPEAAEIDLDIVLHDHGTASRWAANAGTGDPVALWGPRRAYAPPDALAPQLLLADETALPALAAILESLDPRVETRAVIEVADCREHQPLAARDAVEITWLHRDGVPAGVSTRLLDVVRTMDVPAHAYVWGGGEIHLMTAIRKHVRHERGVVADAVSLVGYWRGDDALGV